MAVFRGPDDSLDDYAAVSPEGPAPGRDFSWPVWLLGHLRRRRGRISGILIGLGLGFGFKYLGFLWTLLIAGLAAVGYFIGRRLDETDEDLLDFLDRVLPPGRG